MIIKIEKRYAYAIIGLLVLGIGIFLVNALAPSIDTSQGYHESNQVSVSVSGTEKTLQEAITDGDFGGGVPSGLCMFSRTQTGCPSGWTREAEFDGKTIRGVVTPDGTGGGSESHSHTGPSHSHTMSHTHNLQFKSDRYPGTYYDNTGWAISPTLGSSTANTGASGTGATSSTSSWPPYMNVIVCCKN